MPLDEAKKWLKELPGVGPKTAGIILCFSLGMPAMAVDTHIERVVKRLGLVGPKTTVEKAQDMLEEMVEDHQVYPLHVALITHGRQVCKAPRPLCPRCVLGERCPSRPGFEKQEALRVKKREAAVAAKKKAEAKAKKKAGKSCSQPQAVQRAVQDPRRRHRPGRNREGRNRQCHGICWERTGADPVFAPTCGVDLCDRTKRSGPEVG